MHVTKLVILSVLIVCCHSSIKNGGYSYPQTMDPCGSSGGSCNGVGSSVECVCRTYTFACAVLNDHVYMDSETGEVYGPFVDIVRKICEYAGKLCKFSGVTFSDCWTADGSNVLNGRWYDACVQPVESPVRRAKYAFPDIGLAYFGNPKLMARADRNITAEILRSPHDFVLGWTASPSLIIHPALEAYQEEGYFIKEQNIVYIFDDLNTAIEKQISGLQCGGSGGKQIDIIIITASAILPDNFELIAEIDIGLHLKRHSTMFRKDDQCMLKWYNEAYEKFICSDEYPAFCQELIVSQGNRTNYCQDRDLICS